MLKISRPKITVITRNVGRTVVVGVEDNGIGIKPEDVKRIFDKYYRVSSGNTHDVKGLGLSYVPLIVKAHNGRISVDSQPGRGTRIELFLPGIAESESTDETTSQCPPFSCSKTTLTWA